MIAGRPDPADHGTRAQRDLHSVPMSASPREGERLDLVTAGDDPIEIAMLEARLAAAEADLEGAEQVWADLFGSQSEFQVRYWNEVGSLVVAVAEAREELARLTVAAERDATPDGEPGSDDYSDRAAEAQELRDEYETWVQPEPDAEQPTVALDEDQKRELKALWNKAAKRWHPDHAVDADDRDWRTPLFIAANSLYIAKDIDGLRRLLETEQTPDKDRRPGRRDHLIDQLDEAIRRRDRLIESTEALLASSWAALDAEFSQLYGRGVDPWDRLRSELTRELDGLNAQIGAFG